MAFIEITKKYFDYIEKYKQEQLFRTYRFDLKEMFDKFKTFVQKKCKCIDYEYRLLCDAEHDESRFVEFMYNYIQRNLNSFPENIRDELSKLNKEFYDLYIKKQKKFDSYKSKRVSEVEVAEMEKNWFLVKAKYCEVYSLLFSKEFINNKFRIDFFRKCLEWVENNEEIKFKSFYQLVTSKSFMENKIQNDLLGKSLQIDNVDKVLEEIKYGDDCIEPVIWGILTSKAYYEGKITEESLEILFDEKYRVIKIMVALLMVSKDYTKEERKYDRRQVQEKQNNMELIVALLNYSKKEELCEKFESINTHSPYSIRTSPAYESYADICSHNGEVMKEYYNGEGRYDDILVDCYNPISDVEVRIGIADITDGKLTLETTIQMRYPCLKYNPIRNLMNDIREWLCTERVLPFATRPLIKTLQDKK